MSKPVLYVFAGSVWATAPQLALHELGYGSEIVEEPINLEEGANFHPNFLKLNPNGTLPTLATSKKIYTSTAEVVRYLIDHAPRPAGKPSGTDLLEILHGAAIDPNFSMLSARSEAELKAKGMGIGGRFVRGRQNSLERLARTAPEYKAFYKTKLAQNGFLVSLFDNVAPPDAVRYFIGRSNIHWRNVSQFVSTDLPLYLPASGFIGGEMPGEDDFHLAVWLARTVAVLGGSPNKDGVKSLEKELGGSGSVPQKVKNYWKLWSERESWRILYRRTLH
ncbi:hypothetical protein JB92DRAFT_2827121 [Gautieria morchelliformis]|nr:hypothetical protein JB92DRAFT_2827121 [Gautieria morchelliformis]